MNEITKQWHIDNPQLLKLEKEAMNRAYPQFELDTLDDGRLFWGGEIISSLTQNKYYLMVAYNNNYPFQAMGSSVRVYMLLPDDVHFLGGSYLRPEDTPFNLCAQTLMDAQHNLYQGVWIHKEEASPNSAVKILRLYLAWLSIRECQLESGTNPINWQYLCSLYPSLELIVKDLLYGKM